MKINYMGRRLNGQYDSAKSKLKRGASWVKRMFKLTLIAGIFIGIGMGITSSYAVAYVQPEIIDNTSQKIDSLKDEVINGIAGCESAGYKEDDGILIFDTNKKASIGQLQFQKDTVIHYYKTLYKKDITSKEAVMIALDTDKAKALAKDIVFTTDKGLSNWLNCANKLGLSAEVKAIKKISQ